MKHILNLILLSLSLTIQAQSDFVVSGGNSTGSAGSISFTIGQVFYTDGTGVQQPYEIYVVTGVENETINLSFSAYPNPTTDYLTLKVDNYTEKLDYQLFDVRGQLVETKKLEGTETTINVSNLVNAIYILRVTDNGKLLKTFKIIKN